MQTKPLSYPETPTNTTKTAAYVAVATMVSVLLALKKTDKNPANAKTETLTVTRLFTTVTSGNCITIIGTTNMPPPRNATRNLASRSTNGDTCSGGSLLKYSSVRLRMSYFV